MTSKGRIDIITGCMFSGKSTECIRRINRYKVLKKNILIVNHSLDKRYKENSISTHSNISLNCHSLENLNDIKTDQKYDYQNVEVILIEEAQFFNGLFKFVTESADIDEKIIIVSGLDGDSNREEFGDIIRLIPHCNTITKLHALCTICNDGTLACFTKRIVTNCDKILVGVNEFIPVCRGHFLHH